MTAWGLCVFAENRLRLSPRARKAVYWKDLQGVYDVFAVPSHQGGIGFRGQADKNCGHVMSSKIVSAILLNGFPSGCILAGSGARQRLPKLDFRLPPKDLKLNRVSRTRMKKETSPYDPDRATFG